MARKKKKWNENAVIRGALRRIFARSPVVQDKKLETRSEFPSFKKDGSEAKNPSVRYQCAICKRWFKSSDIAVDHISPVVLDGFKDWNTFIERLFCDKDNLQVLCSYKLKDIKLHGGEVSCHLKKTREERSTTKKDDTQV